MNPHAPAPPHPPGLAPGRVPARAPGDTGACRGHAAGLQVVGAEWVDYNGHLRDAYYLLLFSLATDELMDALGLDAAGRARTGSTLYTLESRLRFLAEVHEGARVRVHTRLVDSDAKRLHLFQTLCGEDGTQVLAECEQVMLHVLRHPKPHGAAFGEALARQVSAMVEEHALIGRPPVLGRVVGLPAARTTGGP